MSDQKFSEQLKVVKLLTSSLFARKQPFMIVNGNKPNEFYYTNIEHSRVALYRATMEDALSKVSIISPEISQSLYDAFPQLKKVVAEINLTDFSTSMNKALKFDKDHFPKINVNENTRVITMLIDPDPKDPNDHIVAEAPIGTLLSELDPDFYEDIIKNYEKFSDNVELRKFRVNDVSGSDKMTLEIVDISHPDNSGKSEFALPIKDGITMVSTKEYVSKRGLDPLYDLHLRVNPLSRTCRGTILYHDDWLDAMTIMPGSLWFMSGLI